MTLPNRITFPNSGRDTEIEVECDRPNTRCWWNVKTGQVRFEPEIHGHVDARSVDELRRTEGAGFIGGHK